jgi:CspA family cold shock protein
MVLQFDQARGYGFVAAEDGGADVFLHASVFDGDADLLAPGAKVEFKIMAGDRGRKAFDARLIDDEDDPGREQVPLGPLVPAARPNPSVMAAPVIPIMPQESGQEDAPEEEPMCDVLSQAELGQELTELLMDNVPTLTGQQILQIRRGVLECARKHGWVDI